jgi:predicted transcriptional regulator
MTRQGRTRPVVGLESTSLGPLELEVLDVMWDRSEPGTVMDVYLPILDNRRGRGEIISPATVMTVMNRLAKKGLVDRQKSEGTSIYRPMISREEMAKRMIDGIVQKVLRGEPQVAIEYLTSKR